MVSGGEKTGKIKKTSRKVIDLNLIILKTTLIKEYYEQLSLNKFDNLGEMDKFFVKHKLPNLTQEKKIENLNSSVSIKDTDL